MCVFLRIEHFLSSLALTYKAFDYVFALKRHKGMSCVGLADKNIGCFFIFLRFCALTTKASFSFHFFVNYLDSVRGYLLHFICTGMESIFEASFDPCKLFIQA